MRPTDVLSRAYRKLRLTTKDINKGYYKGNRTGSMGRHTKWGGYVIQWKKVRTYVVPSGMDTFKLTPFVTNKMRPTLGFGNYAQTAGPKSPELYLERWKQENGLD